MRLSHVQFSFNRAASYILSKQKCLIVFILLLLIGVVTLTFKAAAYESTKVAALGLLFIPFFLSIGLLFSLGIFLSRLYHDEVKGREISMRKIFLGCWDLMVATSYFSLPLFVAYVVLWFLLAVFALMKSLPVIGPLVMVFFSFAPFLINVILLLLIGSAVVGLFFLTPVLAFQGLNREKIAIVVENRLRKDSFANFFLVMIAFLPLAITLMLLFLAVWMTEHFCLDCQSTGTIFLSSLFILIPFMALITPAVIFFFNFAIEAHVLMKNEVVE